MTLGHTAGFDGSQWPTAGFPYKQIVRLGDGFCNIVRRRAFRDLSSLDR
jgi:hypothetical protein